MSPWRSASPSGRSDRVRVFGKSVSEPTAFRRTRHGLAATNLPLRRFDPGGRCASVPAILQSDHHALLSGRTMLITLENRETSQPKTFPVNYLREGAMVWENIWKRALPCTPQASSTRAEAAGHFERGLV